MGMEVILASVLFLIVGAAAGFVVRNLQATKELNERKSKGDEIISEGIEIETLNRCLSIFTELLS